MPTRRAGRSGAAVRTFSPRKSAAASAETTSAGIDSTTASATAVLPLAVGPKSASTLSATKPLARELEILVGQPGCAEKIVDAAVPALELFEHAHHRLGGRRGNAPESFAFRLGAGFSEPRFVPRLQPFLAQGVIGRDLLFVDAGDVQQEGGHEPGAVLPAHAMNDDGAFRSP